MTLLVSWCWCFGWLNKVCEWPVCFVFLLLFVVVFFRWTMMTWRKLTRGSLTIPHALKRPTTIDRSLRSTTQTVLSGSPITGCRAGLMPSIHQPVPCPSINLRKTNDLCVCVFEGVITVKISSTELRERRQSSSAFKIRLQTFRFSFLILTSWRWIRWTWTIS